MKTKIVFGAAVGAVVSVAAMSSAFALDYRPAEIAQLQGLDKITARISTFEVPVGQMAKFGTLSIRVDACYRTPPEERHRTGATGTGPIILPPGTRDAPCVFKTFGASIVSQCWPMQSVSATIVWTG